MPALDPNAGLLIFYGTAGLAWTLAWFGIISWAERAVLAPAARAGAPGGAGRGPRPR